MEEPNSAGALSLSLEDFLSYVYGELGWSTKNTRIHQRTFLRLKNAFTRFPFTNEGVTEYFLSRRKEGIKNSSLNTELKYLKAIAACMGLSFLSVRKYYREDEPYRETLTLEEQRAILLERQTRRKNGQKRQKEYSLAIEVLLKTGLRVGELLALTPQDVRPYYLVVRESKNGAPREVPITQELYRKLTPFTPFNLKQQYLDKELKKRAKERGIIKNVSPHTLRHTFITMTVNSTRNPLKVSRVVGHKNANTTNAYYHPTVQDLMEVVESNPISAGEITKERVMEMLQTIQDRLKNSPYQVSLTAHKSGFTLHVSE